MYGKMIGVRNRNPILESRVYTVKFDEGTLRKYVENLIDKNMYAQVNNEGRDNIMI